MLKFDRQLILEMPFGSRLYGLATPTSDMDIKRIMMPSIEELILNKPIRNVVTKTNKVLFQKNTFEDVDTESVPILSFMYHVLEGQTYAIEMLNAVPSFVKSLASWHEDGMVTWAHPMLPGVLPIAEFLDRLKTTYVTRNVTKMIGYSMNQAKVYSIKGERLSAIMEIHELIVAHRQLSDRLGVLAEAFLKAQEKFPTYVKVDEYEEANTGRLAPCVKIGEKIFPYSLRIVEAETRIEKYLKEYGARAKKLVMQEDVGADWKALMHAMRIVDNAIELLTTGKISLPVSQERREYLLGIKTGQVEKDVVVEGLAEKLTHLRQLEQTCTILPAWSQELEEQAEKEYLDMMKNIYRWTILQS